MGLRNTREGWGWLARLLHWSMAAMILFMLGLGFYMSEVVEDIYEKFGLVQIHKSWGFTVFVLAIARLVWRRLNPVSPDLPDHMAGWEKAAATGGHIALYALLLAVPITGWLMVSASELQELYSVRNMVFGLFEMPDPFIPGDKALEDMFRSMHSWLVVAMTALVAGHAGAALKHHFVNRDTVLRRMIRGR